MIILSVVGTPSPNIPEGMITFNHYESY